MHYFTEINAAPIKHGAFTDHATKSDESKFHQRAVRFDENGSGASIFFSIGQEEIKTCSNSTKYQSSDDKEVIQRNNVSCQHKSSNASSRETCKTPESVK